MHSKQAQEGLLAPFPRLLCAAQPGRTYSSTSFRFSDMDNAQLLRVVRLASSAFGFETLRHHPPAEILFQF